MPISDYAIMRSMEQYSAVRGKGILANLVAFGRVLKESGVKVTLSQVLDAGRSLECVGITCRRDFQNALRANLISDREEIPIFDRVFSCFWRAGDAIEESRGSGLNQAPPSTVYGGPGQGEWINGDVLGTAPGLQFTESANPLHTPFGSDGENLNQKDFSAMEMEDGRAISRAILLIAHKIATSASRRQKRSLRGDRVDLRWTLRKNIKYGGDLITLVRRKRRIRKTRIILLCDVSGSMDCYSRFLIQFMYALQNELWGVETFVFSTNLSRITHLIGTRDVRSALAKISLSATGWSGGTNIGGSLQSFNREFAPALVTKRTLIVILSDGWDRGDSGVLRQEMKQLKRRCYKVIWLNPLLANEGYEPICKGMQTALPFLDFFLPAHNLNSLIALGRTLPKMMF